MKNLSKYTASIEKAIASVDLPNQPENLYEPIKYFLEIGGKRIRPALTMLSADLFNLDPNRVLNQALAVELFHNFTLIHDDIMDQAPVRRGKPTVHTKWNSTIGILSGDALLIKAYQRLQLNSGEKIGDLLHVFNNTALEVCEGQQMDMDFEERSDVSVAEYIEMIRLKTSVLLGAALEFGAIMAGATEADRKRIKDFGQHIGIAFQIKDDILDLYGDPEKFGKQIGGDIIANKKTILYLTATTQASIEQREILTQLRESSDPMKKVNRTRELFDHLKVKENCEERMRDHYTKALLCLDSIPVDDSRKKDVRQLAEYLIERDL